MESRPCDVGSIGHSGEKRERPAGAGWAACYKKNYDKPRQSWHKVHLHTICGTELVHFLYNQGTWLECIPYEVDHDSLID